MKKLALVLGILIFIPMCTDEGGARSALSEAGYTHIEIKGYKNACHQDDSTCTEFYATAPGGKARTHGVVGCTRGVTCSKSCTIRILAH